MLALLLSLLVGLTGIDRSVDPGLQAIADQRVIEIQSSFDHHLKRPGTTEIIAYNSGYADPVRQLVTQWHESAPHWAILRNPALTRWACAVTTAGENTYGVCVFSGALGNTAVALPLAWPFALLIMAVTCAAVLRRLQR